MPAVQMRPGVYDGGSCHSQSIRYPADQILLRVVDAGDVQVAEYTSEDREGSPPHTHEWDELEYVIEGTVEFYVDGRWIPGGPGTVQMLPAGTAHAVRVPHGTARVLMVTIGRPYDGFARDLAEVYAAGSGGAAMVAAAARHGVRLADGP